MFRPSFENLEKREVFSVAPPLVPAPEQVYVEEISFDSHTRPVNDGIVVEATNPSDALVATTFGRGIMEDFDSDGRPDLAIKSPRDSASGQATAFVDDLIGWDFRSRQIDTATNNQMGILPYMEQDNLYKLADDASARDLAFGEHGEGNGIIAVLIGLVQRRDIAVDPSDTTGNTVVERRASVTDLVIDPFNSSLLIGTDGGIWRASAVH